MCKDTISSFEFFEMFPTEAKALKKAVKIMKDKMAEDMAKALEDCDMEASDYPEQWREHVDEHFWKMEKFVDTWEVK